jgi:hypothetical protein
MELTGKCKEEFEKWFTNSDNRKGFDAEQIALDRKYRLKVFYQLYPSMQYGVYVDFFDSVEIYISLDWYKSIVKDSEYFETDINNHIDSERFKHRPEARVAVIKKANEIYNNAH